MHWRFEDKANDMECRLICLFLTHLNCSVKKLNHRVESVQERVKAVENHFLLRTYDIWTYQCIRIRFFKPPGTPNTWPPSPDQWSRMAGLSCTPSFKYQMKSRRKISDSNYAADACIQIPILICSKIFFLQDTWKQVLNSLRFLMDTITLSRPSSTCDRE